MRIANWNVNSVRTRVDRIVAALARLDIDVLLVQETKCKDTQFPFDAFPGYEIAHHGLLVVAHIGEFEVECEIDVAHLSAELDQTVDRGAVVAEIASDVQIGQ